MKFVHSLLVAALAYVPVASFAQSNHAFTRADVHADRVRLQKAGYNPAGDDTRYPKNVEAAEARVADQQAVAAAANGGVEMGYSVSRAKIPHASVAERDVAGLGSIYAHS